MKPITKRTKLTDLGLNPNIKMRILKFKNSLAAFMGINEYLIFNEKGIKADGIVSSSQNIMYDTMVRIHKSEIPPDWDFTKTVNYRKSKWTSLVGNYLNIDQLQEVIAEVQSREIKKSKSYNVSMLFANSHGGGKGCLLSCTYSRRPHLEVPLLIVTVRASETYKRLMFDLLLIHRMGEEAYGEDADFSINIFFPHSWVAVSWSAMFIHLLSPERITQLEEEYGTNVFSNAVKAKYEYFKSVDWTKFNYNADKRAAKVIQGDIASPPVLARDCFI